MADARGASDVVGIRYIETSALLAALLEQDATAKRSIRAAGQRITCSLTFAEANRALVRARTSGRLSAAQHRSVTRALKTFAARCDVIAITDGVLARAGRPFPVEPIRTLDALHLAAAEILGEFPALVTVVTRADRIARNAAAMGYAVE